MDRTVIDARKAEEKDLSDQLHKKLTALATMIQPPTDEFKKCFVEDMFLKPNQKAFFHVMHYLFTLLDPVEFKKRFYWPIADKKSEANFRTSTVQYLTHLNEKHSLQWKNIKSYLVVMPGGIKFIQFLLDLTGFITKELIKQREKALGLDSEAARRHVSECSIQRMMEQNKIHKMYASRYVKEIDLQIVLLKEKTDTLRKHLSSISIPGLDMVELLNDSFLADFATSNRQLFEKNLKQSVTNVCALEDPLKNLKETLERFQNHEAGAKDYKEKVKQSLLKLKSSYPELDIGTLNGDVQLGTLLAAFNRIYPEVQPLMVAVDQQGNDDDFIGNELSALKSDILQIETQLTKFLSSLNAESKNPKTNVTPCRASGTDDVLMSKFVNTPPIRLNMVDGNMNINPRLPFLDDFMADRSMDTFCSASHQSILSNALAVPRSTKKNLDNSTRQPQSGTKSKIVDPLTLLRTLHKDTPKSRNVSRNLSALGSKWKKHMEESCLFGPADADQSRVDQSQNMSSLFGSNDKTAVTRQRLDVSLLATPSDASLVYSRKISAVQKVQDASLNLHNLSTSPSGRLDPLVAFDPKEFPKIKLNDETLLEATSNKATSLTNGKSTEMSQVDLDRSFVSKQIEVNSGENDSDEKKCVKNSSCDTIFDTSDGVLNDYIV